MSNEAPGVTPEARIAELEAQVGRLQTVYQEVEVDAVEDGTQEYCINHPKADEEDVAESIRQGYRKGLQPGDLDPIGGNHDEDDARCPGNPQGA